MGAWFSSSRKNLEDGEGEKEITDQEQPSTMVDDKPMTEDLEKKEVVTRVEIKRWTPDVLSLSEYFTGKGFGELYFGKYPELSEADHLVEHLKIHTFVNLTEQFERTGRDYKYNTISFPIIERYIPDNTENFLDLVVIICSKLRNKENIYIHCKNGRGRTGMLMVLVVANLANYKYSMEDCYQLVYRAHRLGHGAGKAWLDLKLPPRQTQRMFIEELYHFH